MCATMDLQEASISRGESATSAFFPNIHPPKKSASHSILAIMAVALFGFFGCCLLCYRLSCLFTGIKKCISNASTSDMSRQEGNTIVMQGIATAGEKMMDAAEARQSVPVSPTKQGEYSHLRYVG